MNHRAHNAADAAVSDHLMCRSIPESESAVVVHAQVHAALARGGNHSACIIQTRAQGFLAKDVTSGGNGFEARRVMDVIGSAIATASGRWFASNSASDE